MKEIIALLTLINSYRADHGLNKVTLDSTLSVVAKAHAVDFVEKVKTGNGHLWSDGSIGQAAASKSIEFGYPAAAAEIAHYHYPNPATLSCDPKCCFQDWLKSPTHNDVLLNLNAAKNFHWKSVGIAIYKGYACAWFGEY